MLLYEFENHFNDFADLLNVCSQCGLFQAKHKKLLNDMSMRIMILANLYFCDDYKYLKHKNYDLRKIAECYQ